MRYSMSSDKIKRAASLLAALCLFLFLPAVAQAQEPVPEPRLLTVTELFEQGVRNSLELQTARLSAGMAADRLKSARTAYLPSVDITLTEGYAGNPTIFRRGLKNASATDIPNWQHTYGVEFSQPLFTGGKIKYSVKKSEIEEQIAALAVTQKQADVKLYLVTRYLELFNLYKEKNVYNKNIEESDRRLHDIRQMRKEGMITRNDVIRSELQLSGYRLSLREVENDIVILSQQLDIALGLDETLLLAPDTAFLSGSPSLEAYEEYVRQAYEHYPEAGISRLDISLAEKNVFQAKAAYLPGLSFRAGNTLGRPVTGVSPAQDLFMNNWNMALVIDYSLSSLYRNKHKVNEARRQVKINRTREELLKQQIRMNVKSAYVRHSEALERINTLVINVRQADENYRIVQNKYLNHLAILTDLLDASSVRLDAELQLTSARTDAVYTYYQLLHETGNL